MSGAGPAGAGGPGRLGDDDLERALSAGLSRALGGGVDTDALVRGAHHGARRIRQRRQAVRGAVAAVILVAMVPVGLKVFAGGGLSSGSATAGGAAPEAATAAAGAGAGTDVYGTTNDSLAGSAPAAGPDAASSPAAPGPSKGAEPSPTRLRSDAVPGLQFSADGTLKRSGGDVVVPIGVMLAADELGLADVRTDADMNGRDLVPTVTPLCEGLSGGDRIEGGRMLRVYGTAGSGGEWTVLNAVTVFAGDGAQTYTDALRRGVGTAQCADTVGASRESIDGLPGDEALLTVLPAVPDERGARVVGVVRSGKVLVAVGVVVPVSAAPDADARRALALTKTRSLLTDAVDRAAALADAAASDPSLT